MIDSLLRLTMMRDELHKEHCGSLAHGEAFILRAGHGKNQLSRAVAECVNFLSRVKHSLIESKLTWLPAGKLLHEISDRAMLSSTDFEVSR